MLQDAQAAYEELIRRTRETALLDSCGTLLFWDERTYMPKQGIRYRAQQLALLKRLRHEQATAPAIGELLAVVEESSLVDEPRSVTGVNIREVRRRYERLSRVPAALVEELARVTTLAARAWEEARTAADFAILLPHLEQVVNLKRQEAAALAGSGSLYDALLDSYEPGATAANVSQVFSALRRELVALLRTIAGADRQATATILQRDYPVERQEGFARMLAAAIGIDFAAARLDVTAHPFCLPIGPGDTRLTTRYHPTRWGDGCFATLHEAGHGLYNQGLDPDHTGTPMGWPVRSSIHESQARLWENLVGRSRAFWQHFFPQAQQSFPAALGAASLDEFYAAINHVQPSFIRVAADELTYNLHIMLRFELEQALIDGTLSPADVPAAWNEKYQAYLDLTPPDDAQGCLQDVHWGAGFIGYFPTYTLGNLYAAQFFAQARQELGDLDAQFAAGDFAPLRTWLTEKIYRQGMRYRAGELVEHITGRPLSHQPLVDYLKAKFKRLYGI